TLDAGATWYALSGDLPDVPVQSIAVYWGSPESGDEVLFLGTDRGLFVSYDYGTAWYSLGEGLPNAQVNEVELNVNLGILSAVTHGRGLWQLDVSWLTG